MGVTPGTPRQGGLSNEDVQSAITAALAAYTPTANLAPIATSGSASDLITGTLANARLSAQVVRSDFSYPDPAWVTSIAATKLTGTIADARLGSNVPLKNASNVFTSGNTFADVVATGTLQIGGASGHLLRWNAGASSLEVRDSANSFYRKTRVGELQVIADTGGSVAVPANSRIGFLTQIGGYIAGAISGRTYSANAAHGDIIISACLSMVTGQNDYSGLTDDLVVRGLTGNIEINRGLLGIGMAGQAARSVSILPANTGDRTGVRVYDYGTYATSASQSGFEVAYLGGLPSAPSTTIAGHSRNLLSFRTGGSTGALSTVPSFAIRSTIGAVIGSSLSEVNTSLMITPTSTGVPVPIQTMFGNTGLVDFPIGQIQLGSNVRLKNSSGDFHVRNSGDTDFAGISASTGNFSNVISASNGVKVSGSAGVQYSSATPVPGSGSIPWIVYTANTNTLFTRDTLNSRMFMTMAGGVNSSSSNLQVHANAYIESSLFVSGGGGLVFANSTPAVVGGSHPWLAYTANSNVFYIRDAFNGRMQLTLASGANATAANTTIASRLSVESHITSAFQTLSSDPSTLDITAGLARLVKNTTSGEIAKFINDAGVIRRITTSPPWSSILSKPTTLAGYGITDAVASNDARITNGAITFLIDGGGSVIAVGEKSLLFRVPYNCTITGWELVANASGSIVIDVWKDSYANFPPTNGDSIVAAAKPTLASQVKAQSSTLTGWTTALNAGDYIKLEVESASTVNVAVLTLTVTRT